MLRILLEVLLVGLVRVGVLVPLLGLGLVRGWEQEQERERERERERKRERDSAL